MYAHKATFPGGHPKGTTQIGNYQLYRNDILVLFCKGKIKLAMELGEDSSFLFSNLLFKFQNDLRIIKFKLSLSGD
jgi:hypothetical protein